MSLSECHTETSFQPQHLWTSFETQANQYPDDVAIIKLRRRGTGQRDKTVDDPRTTLTFGQLRDAATAMARELHRHGVSKGDFVGVALPNCIEYLVVLWATFRLGAILMPITLGVLEAPSELEHMLATVKPKVMVVSDLAKANTVSNSILGREAHCKEGQDEQTGGFGILQCSDGQYTPLPPWPDCTLSPTGKTPDLNDLPETSSLQAADDALVLFTSGSTGSPKGCLHTHSSYSSGTHGFAEVRHMGPGSRLLAHRPIVHGFSLASAIAMMLAGGAVVLPYSEDFDPSAAIDALMRAQATHLGMIPNAIHALVAHPDFPGDGFPSLESVELGGDLVSPAVISLCKNKLRARYVSAGFGMTETCGLLGHDNHALPASYGDTDDVAVSVGKPLPGVGVKLCDPGAADQTIVEPGQEGEMHIRGSSMFRKYLGATTTETNYRDSKGQQWFRTGDQATMDDEGNVTIIGRYKDTIIRDGACLAPSRIGVMIEQMDRVDKAIVVPLQHETSGQVPVAVVQHNAKSTRPTEAQIQEHVTSRMGSEHAPHRVLDLADDLKLDSWPLTAAGKADKKLLQERVRGYPHV